jgi:hypothetical protein
LKCCNEVDLVVAEIGADARALGERARIAAAELDRDRMLGRVGEMAQKIRFRKPNPL